MKHTLSTKAFKTRLQLRWAIFISGRGSNLSAVLNEQDLCSSKVKLVVSSSSQAAGLLKAKRAGVETLVLPKRIDWRSLSHELRRRRIEQIFLLGFMRVVPEGFLADWSGQILNLHPSLLPKYPGLKSIERAFHDGASLGATVHDVVSEVDAGERLLQIRSLNAAELSSYALETAEMKVHQDEQRLVREAFRRWRAQQKKTP